MIDEDDDDGINPELFICCTNAQHYPNHTVAMSGQALEVKSMTSVSVTWTFFSYPFFKEYVERQTFDIIGGAYSKGFHCGRWASPGVLETVSGDAQ